MPSRLDRAAFAAARFVRRHKVEEEAVAEAVAVDAGIAIWKRVFAAAAASAAITATATLAPGLIDLSNNNGSRAVVAIAAPGVKAVEAKATEGLHFRDGLYPTFRAAAAKHHRAFGGYLFLHPGENGAAQADYFLAYAKPKPGDIQPVVDSETGSPAAAAPATYSALHELDRRGYQPILYASSSYLAGLVAADPRLKHYWVWQAEYGPVLHLVPGVRVVAWQFTDRARVGGFSTDGSHLLVRDVALIETRPPKPATAAQKKAAAKAAAEKRLRGRAGYWSWLAWRLGEAAWKPYGKSNPKVRPHVPRQVPAAWWRREHAYLKERTR